MGSTGLEALNASGVINGLTVEAVSVGASAPSITTATNAMVRSVFFPWDQPACSFGALNEILNLRLRFRKAQPRMILTVEFDGGNFLARVSMSGGGSCGSTECGGGMELRFHGVIGLGFGVCPGYGALVR